MIIYIIGYITIRRGPLVRGSDARSRRAYACAPYIAYACAPCVAGWMCRRAHCTHTVLCVCVHILYCTHAVHTLHNSACIHPRHTSMRPLSMHLWDAAMHARRCIYCSACCATQGAPGLACVAVHVLQCMCCSACVAAHVLQCMCCSACVAVHVLQCMCCSACVAVHVLQCNLHND